MEAAAAEQHREALADWEAGQVVAKEAEKVNAAEIRKLIKAKKPADAQALARQDLQSPDAPERRRPTDDPTVVPVGARRENAWPALAEQRGPSPPTMCPF